MTSPGQAKLTGINTVLVTPFNEDESLDVDGIHRVVRSVLGAGVDGVVALGLMGEVRRLTDVERDRVVGAVVDACEGAAPVIVGCSAEATAVAAQRVEAAQRLGADAVMIAPPRGSAVRHLPRHYRVIAATTDLPVVVQDEPLKTGVVLPPSVIAEFLAASNVSYVKVEDEPTPNKITAILEAAPDVTCFGGIGGLYLYEELLRGAAGTMTGFAFPEILVETLRRYQSGETDGARDYFYRYLPLIRFEARLGSGGIANRKQILAERGIIHSAVARQPSDPLDARARNELRSLIASLGLG